MLEFELIQVALDCRISLSTAPTPDEWAKLLLFAEKHWLMGICFRGV